MEIKCTVTWRRSPAAFLLQMYGTCDSFRSRCESTEVNDWIILCRLCQICSGHQTCDSCTCVSFPQTSVLSASSAETVSSPVSPLITNSSSGTKLRIKTQSIRLRITRIVWKTRTRRLEEGRLCSRIRSLRETSHCSWEGSGLKMRGFTPATPPPARTTWRESSGWMWRVSLGQMIDSDMLGIIDQYFQSVYHYTNGFFLSLHLAVLPTEVQSWWRFISENHLSSQRAPNFSLNIWN